MLLGRRRRKRSYNERLQSYVMEGNYQKKVATIWVKKYTQKIYNCKYDTFAFQEEAQNSAAFSVFLLRSSQ